MNYQTNLEKKKKVKWQIVFTFNTFYKATENCDFWKHKDKYVIGIEESPGLDPYIHGQLNFDDGMKAIQWQE